jgi:CRP-like cAMP-binding protein
MSRIVPAEELDLIERVISEHPEGLGISALERALANHLPDINRRTLQRRLKRLQEDRRIVTEGESIALMYKRASKVINLKPKVDAKIKTSAGVDLESCVPASPDGSVIRDLMHHPLRQCKPAGYHRSFPVGSMQGKKELPMNHLSFGELFQEAGTDSKSLAQGEFLFQNGAASTHLYTVLDGCVRMVRFSWDGVPVVMHTACAGDGLAEASLFSPIYHCDAEAILPSTVACYDKKIIMAILRDSPEKALACIALFSRQVRSLRTLLEVRAIRSARERVLHYLMLQADPETMTLSLGGSVKAMAHDLAMASETLYRTLAGLEKEGKISRSPGVIKILS